MPPKNEDERITPLYADSGREKRVTQIGGRAVIAWQEHCQKHDLRMEPLADDRISTRESCCKPDVKTNGRATELMMNDWGDIPFPYRFMNVPFHKLWYGQDYPDGKFVMINHEETQGVSVPMCEDYDSVTWYPDNYQKPMKFAQFACEKCHVFPLGKVDKLKN